jgi:hypothetical protein
VADRASLPSYVEESPDDAVSCKYCMWGRVYDDSETSCWKPRIPVLVSEDGHCDGFCLPVPSPDQT